MLSVPTEEPRSVVAAVCVWNPDPLIRGLSEFATLETHSTGKKT